MKPSSLAIFLLTLCCTVGVSGRLSGQISATNAPPVITNNPANQAVSEGDFASFRVGATGTRPLSFQWFFNGQAITNGTSAVYAILDVQPANAGSYFAIVSNSFGSVTSRVAALVVNGANAFGIVGVPFAYQIPANNNPLGFTASGLPRGLLCDVRSGLIFGVPTQSGSFAVHVEAKSIFGSASGIIVIKISEGEITSAATAGGIVGVPFSYQITADNDPIQFLASGLPTGLRFNNTLGVISGTPPQAGSFTVSLQARNYYGSVSGTVFITVSEGKITSPAGVDGIVGVPLSYQITADNEPIRFLASSLPPGLHFEGTLGVISGAPMQSGSFPIKIEARNYYGPASGNVVFNITDVAIIGGTVIPPTLAITRTGQNVLLSWPASTNKFVLEETGVQQGSWSNATVTVAIQHGQNVVSIPTQTRGKFYRLRRP